MLSLSLPSPPPLPSSTLLPTPTAFSPLHLPSSLFAHRHRRPSPILITSPRNSTTSAAQQQSVVKATRRGAEEAVVDAIIGGDEGDDEPFPSCLQTELMPRHVAVIMDGNGRWAKERGLPASAGHRAGYISLREILRLSRAWGVRVLTVFAFSTENWLRSKEEVGFLMTLFEGVLQENLEDFVRRGIRVSIIGDSSRLPKSLQELAKHVEETTGHRWDLDLVVAVSYSGRNDIVQACQKIAYKVKEGLLEPADITESLMAQELETKCINNFPNPDLLIRTSGELRLSNFLLWQSAYSELFFAKPLWPDFGQADYVEALLSFQQRHRRFGGRAVV